MDMNILNPIKVEVTDAGLAKGNYKKVEIAEGTSTLEISISDSNYYDVVKEMASKLDFDEQIDLIRYLASEVGGIYDFDNPEYLMSEVSYDHEADQVFCKFEEAAK